MATYPEQQGNEATEAEGVERLQYISRLADTFEEYGRDILRKIREDEPEKFWLFVSGVMRWDEALRLARDLSDEDLDLVVARVVAGLREGTPDEQKHPRDPRH